MYKKIILTLLFIFPIFSFAITVTPNSGTEKTQIQVTNLREVFDESFGSWIGIFQKNISNSGTYFSPWPASLAGYGLCGYVGDSRIGAWPDLLQFNIDAYSGYTRHCDFYGSKDFKIVQVSLVSGIATFDVANYTVTNFISAGSFSFLANNADNAFKDTTGTTMGASVGWVGNNLTEIFIGGGLSLLYYLRWWIVALILLSAIVYFSFRAYLFFRT